jgi:hypothetical protein
MPRRAQEGRRTMTACKQALYGSGRWAPVRETAGMSARCLQSVSCWCVLGSLRPDRAGQGAHREVGSEGFEANRRAVAELTANRSARSRRYRACSMEAKEVLGEPGRNKVFAGGTAGKQHALPREAVRSGVRRTAARRESSSLTTGARLLCRTLVLRIVHAMSAVTFEHGLVDREPHRAERLQYRHLIWTPHSRPSATGGSGLFRARIRGHRADRFVGLGSERCCSHYCRGNVRAAADDGRA